MVQIEVTMPKMGESVAEATIVRWLKSEGDTVDIDETLVEIATDKVDTDITSTTQGTLIKCLCKEGDIVEVGATVAIIESESDENQTPITPKPIESPLPTPKTAPIEHSKDSFNNTKKTSDIFLSPLVKTIVDEENITEEELKQIPGTGINGRLTKGDLLTFLATRKTINTFSPQPIKTTEPKQTKPTISINAGDEVVEMDRMRVLISEHMIMSKETAAHVTSFVEADVTNLVNWRNKIKGDFEKREGYKFTYTPVFFEVISKALKEFPMMNVSLNGTQIIKRKNINIGMATMLPSGNLIVPVIKNTDQLNLAGLAKQVNDLSTRARSNQLIPDEIQGGTYTISNIGSFGNIMGTPMINQPQVGIIALGTIKKKPAVIETPQGDTIGIRHFIYLSHSFDHRIVDGSLGGRFVSRVAQLLEEWDLTRTI